MAKKTTAPASLIAWMAKMEKEYKSRTVGTPAIGRASYVNRRGFTVLPNGRVMNKPPAD